MQAHRIIFCLYCLFLTTTSVCVGTSLTAQDNDQNILRSYLTSSLPIDNQNWEISQSPVTGFLYFANSAGLVEYNGISSRLFPMPFKQGIRSVHVNHSGTIFTGSFEDFGFWENDGEGGLTYHSLVRDIQMIKNDEIWNIFDVNDILYFQSFTTIYSFSSEGIKAIQSPGTMLFMFKAGSEFIVQLLGQGLYRFNGNEFTFIAGSQLFAKLKVHALIERQQGHFWICTDKNGIYQYDGNSFTPLITPISEYLQHHTCNAGLAIHDSLLVFGTILNGIVFCDANGSILDSYNYANGLNNNTVLSLYVDSKKGLWIGLDEGANYLKTDSPFKQFADKTGTLGTIYSVFRKDSRLYLGTNHGLFVSNIIYNRPEYDFTYFTIIPHTQGQVWKLFEYGDQLLCGHNEGTFRVNGQQITKISDITGGYCFTGYNDLLLQGTYTGIISFKKDKQSNWAFNKRVIDFYEPTRYIEVDYLGYIWAIHPQKGMYRLELNEQADSVISKLYFNSIADTSDKLSMSMVNNQLMFMTSQNIYAFDYENHTFAPVKSLADGLGEYIRATQIVHHEKNTYWFMLDHKIALFNISRSFEAQKITELIQKYTSLPGREQQVVALDRITMLIPTRKAFTTINLDKLDAPGKGQAPVVTHMVFSGKTGRTFLTTYLASEFSVPSKHHNLTVYLADPARFDQRDKTFFYRIPELGDEWFHTTLDHFTFLNLKHGSYHLQVRSSVSENPAEVVFTIRRPWHISIVAGLLYLLALTAFTFSGIKLFRFELDRHRRLIEYEVRKNKLESELDYKNYELMLTMRYLIRKTEILKELKSQIDTIKTDSSKYPVKFIREMERIIRDGLDSQTEEWKNAMNNLKLSQEGFFRKLKEKFPILTPNDLRLCSYLRMNFTTKEMAHLLNISGRAVEIGRYRLRRKMNLDHHVNLTEFLISGAE